MEVVIVREAEIKDAGQIAKVHVGTWQYAYAGQMPGEALNSLSVEQRTKRWEEILSKPTPGSKNFVAEIDDKIVGFCSVGPCRDEDMDKTTGELWAIYVDPESMNKGVGSLLQEKGLNFLKENEFKKATLWVLTSNEKAIKWYESKGWKLEGKTKIEGRRGFELHETRYIIDLYSSIN